MPLAHRAALAFCLGVLLLLPLAPALAAEADRESALRWYDAVDTDHNEMIDAAEMERVRAKRFPRYDGDGDGYVSLDEFNFALPEDLSDERERRSRRFAVMDTDDDDLLTLDEYLDFGRRVMEAADPNRDGIVTRQEFADTVAPR